MLSSMSKIAIRPLIFVILFTISSSSLPTSSNILNPLVKSPTIQDNESNGDQLAQEQRLALQIITTDSGETSNDNPLTSSSERSTESNDEFGSMSFDNQLNLLDSQLSKNQQDSNYEQTNQQQTQPKRIVINLNSLNPNVSDSNDGAITKLTIGFAPTKQQSQPDNSNTNSKGKSGSDKSKTYALPSEMYKKDPSSSTQQSAQNNDRPSNSVRGTTKGNIMNAIRRQGGIPTVVMDIRDDMEGERVGKPQVKFMLNSEMADKYKRGDSSQQQQQNQPKLTRSPTHSSGSIASASNDVSLQEELANLSGEMESLQEQLDGNSESQMSHHDRDNKESRFSRHFRIDAPRSKDARSFSSEPTISQEYHERPNDESTDAEAKRMLARDRNNYIKGDGGREQMSGNNNYADYSVYKSGPSSPNSEGENRERNEESFDKRLGAQDNFVMLGASRHNFHPKQQVNVGGGGDYEGEDGENSDNNNNNNHIYEESASNEKGLPDEKVESMNNFDGAHRWRQRDFKAPLLMDNSNLLFDEQVGGGDDNEMAKLNDMSSASVAVREGIAPNPVAFNSLDVDSVMEKSPSSSNDKRSNEIIQASKMDERVAQLLDRLKLYTTKDQLMKVARELQGYPSRRDIDQANEFQSNTRNALSPIKQNATSSSLSTEKLKTSQTREPRLGGKKVRSTDDSGSSPSYHLNRLETARNKLPSPIEYDQVDSLLTSATSSSEDNASDKLSTKPAVSGRLKLADKQEAVTGSKLMEEFRDRQRRLKSIRELSPDIRLELSESEAKAQDDYDNESSNTHQSQPNDEDENISGYEEGTSAAAPDAIAAASQNDMNEYTSSNDLIDLFKNNARLYDSDNMSRRSGDIGKNDRFIPDGNEILFDSAGDIVPDSIVGGRDGSLNSTEANVNHSKEEDEIKALEEIIDELVDREKKEKNEKKRRKAQKQ